LNFSEENGMSVMEREGDTVSTGAREYLTFRLDQEEYGIDILKVQEIRGYERPTRIANAPEFIRGVVNLRGTIVPIVDMRLKFNCAKAECNAFTVVIILNLRSRIVGIVVDSVSDVMELPPESLKAAPEMDSMIDSSAVVGLGSVGDRMLILLDIEKLMSGLDMGLVSGEV
jgi:purine-binding chemotaxis protein CheW